MSIENPLKTRNLSPLQYLERLNEEWWVNNLRRKIYPNILDKKRFNRVCSLKKGRIIEICERNSLTSIFTDTELMKQLNRKFAQKGGMPVFEGMVEEDTVNYYYPGSDVRCFYGFDGDKPIIKLGKVVTLYHAENTVQVELADNQLETLELTRVSRIF